jgi:LmbE family N-acetylglucosaminyl deacetylase
MIAAHPDDENTALLAYFARGRSMRTGYLSLTRGEGGQNLIGSEQSDLLGVIRTQELLAARRIDGAEQFFTRAIDFGYSKSDDETLQKWGREKVLSDLVWVIRSFRPDVIVLRFSGTPRDGHGHHQSSAILGKEAFSAAADPHRFPEQLKDVQPWQAKRLMWNVFSFSREQEKEAETMPHRVAVDTGEFNPALGHSYSEIAGMSRSMHRSQGMGAPEHRGSSMSYLVTTAGEPAERDLFDGVDTTWNRVPGGGQIAALLSDAAAGFVDQNPEKTIPLLLKARPLIAAIDDPWAKRKLKELDDALALCAGLWLDATADRFEAAPGSTVKIGLEVINRSHFAIAWTGHSLLSSDGTNREFATAGSDGAGGQHHALAYNEPSHVALTWTVPHNEAYSQPYWLRKPHAGDLYEIEQQQLIGRADSAPVLTAQFTLDFDGTPVTLSTPVRYRYVDNTEGELTRPLVIVPPVAVDLRANVLLFPNTGSKSLEVQLKAHAADASGAVKLDLPAGWKAEPASRTFHLAESGDEQTVVFTLIPPPHESSGLVRAVANAGGKEISTGIRVMAFPHFPAQMVFQEAQAKLERVDVKILAHKIGYVMGAGDSIPEALRQLGCEVTLLSAQDLAERNLSEFDAIVTGVRAYNVRADLRANQQRLLDYVRDGGTLIVQYNVLPGFFGRGDPSQLAHIGPYAITISHDRVSVEEAPVQFPDPQHPLLLGPNRITGHDFDGWIQERGLYFASAWDPRYQPVLESHDPGEKPLAGGTLYTRYGKGVYIFSAYSWFRELPAGVPGAYRIFANMLSARGAAKAAAASH